MDVCGLIADSCIRLQHTSRRKSNIAIVEGITALKHDGIFSDDIWNEKAGLHHQRNENSNKNLTLIGLYELPSFLCSFFSPGKNKNRSFQCGLILNYFSTFLAYKSNVFTLLDHQRAKYVDDQHTFTMPSHVNSSKLMGKI